MKKACVATVLPWKQLDASCGPLAGSPVFNRGSAEDQERWLAELELAEAAESFPSGGSLILAESPAHASEVVQDMRLLGHRAIARGVYVRTTCAL